MAITATFQANFDQFVTAAKSAEASLTGIETTAKSVGVAVAAHLVGADLRRFAGDVQNFATQFVTAFAEEEAAVSRLTTALRAQGTFTPELQEKYAALATEFQRSTRFSDDAITSIQALLVQVGGVMPDQMGAALTAITNLAAGMGPQVGGLEGAALLVAKAFSSDGEALGRLKVILGDTIKPGADMADVLAAIMEKFGGQAAADIETTTGRLAQFKNQSNEVEETVGKLLITVLTPLADFFQSMPDWAQTGIVALGVIGTAVAPLILSFGSLVTTTGLLATAMGITMAGALTTLGALLLPGAAIIVGAIAVYTAFKNWDAIVGFVQNVYNGVKTWLVDKFTAIVDSIKQKVDAVTGFFKGMYDAVVGHSYVPDMVNGIASEMARLSDVMVPPAVAATDQVMAVFRASSEQIVSSWSSAMSMVSQGLGTMGGTVSGQMDMNAYSDSVTKALMKVGTIDFSAPGRGSPLLAASGAGMSSGGVGVNNTFYVNGTGQDVARTVMDEVTRSMKQGRKWPSA